MTVADNMAFSLMLNGSSKAEIDKRVMEEAVVYPGVYAARVLIRVQNLTNLFVNNSYGSQDGLG